MKRNLLIIGFSLMAGLSFSQTQIGNSDMETWVSVSGGNEPENWNSFLTADGGFSGFAANQIEQSSDVRPGSTGTSSARIWSRDAGFSLIANGNMTTGRVNMGAISASSPDNYNFSLTSDADFSEVMTDMPDSLVFWAKFNAAGGSEEARVKAVIHDNYDYRDPEDAAATSHVVGSAVSEFVSTSGWVRFAVAFDYSGSSNDPQFILLTATTNKNAGGGDENDELFIDDIELIYNPAADVDSDGDGVLASAEANDGTSDSDPCDFVLASATETPSSAWDAADCDNDGVSNGQEIIDGTDPLIDDTAADADNDGDGVLASAEANDGTSDSDPCDFVLASATETPSSAWDTADCDGDGVTNGQEIIDGTDPLVHNSASISELLNDGIKVSYSNGSISIISDDKFEGQYSIFNTLGQEIQNGTVSESIEFNSVKGVYFVKMMNSSKIYSFEILVD